MNRLSVVVLTAVLSGSLVVRAQEPISPQAHFDAGRYEDAINAIAAQTGEPSPESIFLAGRSHLHLSRPDEARAQFARLSTGVDPATAWSLVGESAIALVDANPPLAVEKATQAVALAPDRVSSQLSAWARTERGRAVGTGRGRIREGVKHRSGVCLRPLLRWSCVFEAQADRSDGDAPRIFSEARPERAGAGGGDGADAKRARPLTVRLKPDTTGAAVGRWSIKGRVRRSGRCRSTSGPRVGAVGSSAARRNRCGPARTGS